MITIVSGLPRSGTSLMMRMLYAGGMAVVADDKRVFFETKLVNTLPKRTDWLYNLDDCAVKILFPFIRYVPTDIPIRLIWMDRDLTEQAKSQKKILRKIGEEVPKNYVSKARKANKRLIKNLIAIFRESGNILLLRISFEDAVRSPRVVSEQLSLLIKTLDVNKMAKCAVKRSPKNYPGMMEIKEYMKPGEVLKFHMVTT